MIHRAGLLLLVATVAFACSDRTLNDARAADVIQQLEQFKREAHFTIRTDTPLQTAFRCENRAEIERVPVNQFVVDRGWVSYETREAILGFGSKSSCPAMVLTPAGKAASEGWRRGRIATGEGTAWGIPVARREFVGVTALTTAADQSARVEFDWKWVPNETGTALRKLIPKADALFDQAKKGRASCRRSNNGWQCQMGMWTTPTDVGEFQF